MPVFGELIPAGGGRPRVTQRCRDLEAPSGHCEGVGDFERAGDREVAPALMAMRGSLAACCGGIRSPWAEREVRIRYSVGPSPCSAVASRVSGKPPACHRRHG